MASFLQEASDCILSSVERYRQSRIYSTQWLSLKRTGITLGLMSNVGYNEVKRPQLSTSEAVPGYQA